MDVSSANSDATALYAVTPESGTLSLLGLAGLVLRRRKNTARVLIGKGEEEVPSFVMKSQAVFDQMQAVSL